MKKILLAIDGSNSSNKLIESMSNIFCDCLPEVVVLYVQKIEGASVMDDLLLSDSEIETLKESLLGTDHQEMLDKKSQAIMDNFLKLLGQKGVIGAKSVIKEGHPAEEIIKTAREEGVELIIVGCRVRRLHNLFMGSISREVSNNSEISVLIVK